MQYENDSEDFESEARLAAMTEGGGFSDYDARARIGAAAVKFEAVTAPRDDATTRRYTPADEVGGRDMALLLGDKQESGPEVKQFAPSERPDLQAVLAGIAARRARRDSDGKINHELALLGARQLRRPRN